jgi:predicted MPP superfamily phosphohydrolase
MAVTGFRSAMRLPPYKRITLRFPNLPPGLEGFRIAQITDIHIGAPLNRAQLAAIVAKTNALGADMIALTGDLVDGSVKTFASEVASIADLTAPHGVYFVTGNHEYYSGHQAWCEEVARLGLTVLNNEHRIVDRGGARLLVGGVTDFTGGQFDPSHASDPKKALAGAAQHDFRLLLAHQPKSIPAAREAGFDLQLSGHTHGGQFFPGPLFVGLFNPLAAGLGRFGKLQCYVSRGTGCWGPPFRVGAPPEITEITLARG